MSDKIISKTYFRISEAAKICKVKQAVLRYWETQFSQLQPVRRYAKWRYYQQKDIEIIKKIKYLRYKQLFTIAGVKLQLKRS